MDGSLLAPLMNSSKDNLPAGGKKKKKKKSHLAIARGDDEGE